MTENEKKTLLILPYWFSVCYILIININLRFKFAFKFVAYNFFSLIDYLGVAIQSWRKPMTTISHMRSHYGSLNRRVPMQRWSLKPNPALRIASSAWREQYPDYGWVAYVMKTTILWNPSCEATLLLVCLFVFNVPSTARSFRDGTPIYCPLRRTWSSVNTLFPLGIEPWAFALEKWPFKRGGLFSGVVINTFMFRLTYSSGLSRGGGLLPWWPLKGGFTVCGIVCHIYEKNLSLLCRALIYTSFFDQR